MCSELTHSFDDSVSPIYALYSLTETQAEAIISGLHDLERTWSVERHQSCDGHLSLLLSNGLDYFLLVNRDSAGIQISPMLGDELHSSGRRYASADEVTAALNLMMKTGNTGLHRRSA